MSSGGGEATVGYRYFMGLHMGLCLGPVDAMTSIKIGDRVAWTGNVTASGTATISAENLFGGEEKEGGVVGTVDVMMGEATQGANSYLSTVQSGPQPGYRGIVSIVFRQGAGPGLISMNNPYIKPWAPLLTRVLKGWQGNQVWYSAKASITLSTTAGPGMNPAHIIYECLTNAEWGMGYGSSLIDDTNFKAAADTFFNEGLGLCMLWTRQVTVDNFIQTVADHAGANLVQDPKTGLFKLIPLRADYTVSALPLFDESNIISIDSFERAAPPEAVNEITVKFRELATGADSTVTVQNLANITAQGGIVAQTKEYPGLPTSDLALRVAMRDLRVVSSPLAKIRMRVNRSAYALLPGSVIRVNWPRLGLVNFPVRVLRVNSGGPTAASIEIEGAEDVFGLGATSYASQPPVGWKDPNNDPQAVAGRAVWEAPWYELQRTLSSGDLSGLSGDEGYLQIAAAKPTSDTQTIEIRTRVGTSGAFAFAATGPLSPSGTLTTAIDRAATTAALTNLRDSDLIAGNRYAIIDSEIIRIDSFSAGTGVVTFGRGVLDTVAAPHALGATMLFADPYDATDSVQRVDGDVIQVKLLTRTGKGLLAEASAPTDTVTFDQRFYRPYPPGRLRIAGQTYPTSLTDTLPVITWAHRDRTSQNLQGDESGNIGPEPGVTYSIELRNGTSGALIASQTLISGTTYTPAAQPRGDFPLRVVLWASRGTQTTTTAVGVTATVTVLQAATVSLPQIIRYTFSGTPVTSEQYRIETLAAGRTVIFYSGSNTTVAAMVASLGNVVDSDPQYSATWGSSTLDITGPVNTSFTYAFGGSGIAYGAPYLDSTQRHDYTFRVISPQPGVTLAPSASLIVGAATGQRNPSASGVVLAPSASIISGAASSP